MKTGSEGVSAGDVVLFSDVDVLLDESAVDRCVHLAVRGETAYFPLHFVYVTWRMGESYSFSFVLALCCTFKIMRFSEKRHRFAVFIMLFCTLEAMKC